MKSPLGIAFWTLKRIEIFFLLFYKIFSTSQHLYFLCFLLPLNSSQSHFCLLSYYPIMPSIYTASSSIHPLSLKTQDLSLETSGHSKKIKNYDKISIRRPCVIAYSLSLLFSSLTFTLVHYLVLHMAYYLKVPTFQVWKACLPSL